MSRYKQSGDRAGLVAYSEVLQYPHHRRIHLLEVFLRVAFNVRMFGLCSAH